MSAELSLRQGDPDTALQELQQLVRKEPAKAGHRVFLFQLLCVHGQWQRAKTQLDVLRDLDDGALALVNMYRTMLRCEVLRQSVFAGKRTPVLFGEPQQWAAAMVQAMQMSAQGRADAAQALRAQALEQAPATAGHAVLAAPAEGQPPREFDFQWLADADSRLGPLLEMVVNGKYYWVPQHCVASVRVEAPSDLRDLVWLPAQVRWQNGGDAVAMLPVRYPGSETAAPPLRLARRTEWQDRGHDEFHGLGQRLLTTDADEFGLLDLRELRFAAPSA